MALVDPNIAMSYRGIELPNQLAQYGQVQQIQAAQNQNRMADLQMQEYERARTEAEGLRNFLSGADLTDPTARAGLARFGESGLKYGKALTEQETAALTQRETKFKVAKARQDFMAQTLRDISRNPSDANITAYMEDLASSPLFSTEEKAGISSTASRILAMPIDQRGAFMASQGASPGELKDSTIQINRNGQTDVARVPAFSGAPTTIGTYADVPLPENVVKQKRDIARAGGTNVNIDTSGKKYGERFGTLAAENDMKLMTTAQSAPELAATADRITDLLATGKVITGTGANARLQIAKALNLVGGNDDESIRNTEVLVSQLASTTLESIKSSGLGSGQGFTDKDREFLEKARAGQITYDASSLAELARLSRLTAEKSAETWNSRAKKIPSEALEGTGLSTDPVVIPKRGGAPIYATNGKDRIMSTDGGNTWKPAK
jgi:hypothetical protein